MNETNRSEVLDTALSKIRLEVKSRLVSHGLYGTVTSREADAPPPSPLRLAIDVAVKGRIASREFDRPQVEACYLRVSGPVLAGIISMVEELST